MPDKPARTQLTLTEVDPTSDPLQVRRLINRVAPAYRNKPGVRPTKVHPVEAAVVWLWSLLKKRSPVQPEQIDYLVETVQSDFLTLFADLYGFFSGTTANKKLPVYQLIFVDNTFCGLTCWKYYIDLRDGTQANSLSQAPIEVVSYNLTALFAFHWHRIQSTESEDDAEVNNT